MSTAENFPFSIVQQKAMISADLNSTLLYQFLFGIYTGLFPSTMYIYIHKENRTRTRDMIIIGSTGALYFFIALNTVTNWLYTNILFITQGATRVDIFVESITANMPLGERIVDDLTMSAVFLFADSLLVWRCYHACGRSLCRSLLPIILLTVETVLALSIIIYQCFFDGTPKFETLQTTQISNRLKAATLVTVAATSLVSTVLICLRIWRHTALSSRSRKHYQTITVVLIESSTLYTVAVLLLAIADFTTTGNIETTMTFADLLIQNFAGAASQIMSGMAPTLMIARLFVYSGQEGTEVSSAHLPSDLISHTSHTNGANVATLGPNQFIQEGKQENEEIQVVPRSEYRGQPKDELEETLETVV
ncbi:hypothetical protein D9613_010197 [Agrocybe pediades]|uniref:Uncharacterized protein n=1 Tax=Agrocybe pediades TaxID=84607 RepID=A0A8H4QF91_9AGAR|nr:hypothetical protein D9613_010197 [Agrocybe pediades]